jgi:TetR/AcrR family transcriptional regulator, mexJK operon transcriptional repressor
MTASEARVDPRVARSRELILDAALAQFLEHGYLDATVDALAAEAGVAKRTVYNLYGTKDDLFRAVVHWATDTAARFVADRVEEPLGARPVADELRDLAESHALAVVTPRVIAVRRLLLGEAHRFPDLAAEYFDRVPAAVIAALARRMRRYGESGALTIPDADEAADHFAYLVLGASLDRALFHPAPPSDAALRRAARTGAAAFHRAYAPR